MNPKPPRPPQPPNPIFIPPLIIVFDPMVILLYAGGGDFAIELEEIMEAYFNHKAERALFSSDAPYCMPLTARTIIEQITSDRHILEQVFGRKYSSAFRYIII